MLCLAAVLFALPLVTQAAFQATGPVLNSLSMKVWLTTPEGAAIKSVVEKSKPFAIHWEATGRDINGDETDKGITCKTNFWPVDVTKADLPSKSETLGPVVESISASRSFVITCSGIGASKTVKGKVEVGGIDLAASSLSIGGLKKPDGAAKNTFVVGDATYRAKIKNIGRLSTATTFKVKYYLSTNVSMDGKWGKNTDGMGTADVNGIKGSETKSVDFVHYAGVGTYYVQFCVDGVGNAIHETNEDNNCSAVFGPYKFVNQ